MQRLVVGEISVSRGRIDSSRQDAINISFSTGGRSAGHAYGYMVPLPVAQIITQVEVIRGSAVRQLETQLTTEEVDCITVDVRTIDLPLIDYGQGSMNRVNCPNPGVDGEVSARSKVHGRIVGHRNAVGPVDTHGQTDFSDLKRGVVYQRPVVRAENIITIASQWPPTDHPGWYWGARWCRRWRWMAFATGASVVDVRNASCTHRRIEEFYFVDLSDEVGVPGHG
jgi:hypothetical protein